MGNDFLNVVRACHGEAAMLPIATGNVRCGLRRDEKDTNPITFKAMRVKLKATAESVDGDVQRQFELHCYFSHFLLEDAHLFSGLYGAMKVGYKQGYFATTAVLCRRILELSVSGKVRSDASAKYTKQVQKVLKRCDAKKEKAESVEAERALRYKAHDFVGLCAWSLEPLERGQETAKSPLCGSLFKAEFAGKLSPVCELVRIGGNNEGLTINTK